MDSPTRIIGLDINQGESSGSVFRLYNAAFNRAPDGFEVGYHVNDIESNEFQLLEIARNFLLSPEFSKTYGVNQSDEDYVKTLYENVLNRTPEDFELKYYTDQFESFSTERAKTLLTFPRVPKTYLSFCLKLNLVLSYYKDANDRRGRMPLNGSSYRVVESETRL